MNKIFKKLKKPEKIMEILILTNVFFITFSLPLGNLFSTLILLTWLFSGDYKGKISIIIENKVFLFSFLYFLLHITGFLWSEDIKEAGAILRKHRWFLFIPIFGYYIDKYSIDIQKIFNIYILSNCVTVFFSYLIYFGIRLPDIFVEELYCYTPFHHHVDHSILIAIASYFLLRKIIMGNNKLIINIGFSVLYIIMIHNMIITLGRSGQGTMFIGIFFILIEYFKKYLLKGILVSAGISMIFFVLLYNFNTEFKVRVNAGINDIKEIEHNKNSSLGLRYLYWKNSFDIWNMSEITRIIGVGTGDFSIYFEKFHNERHPNLQLIRRNPHNYYVLLLARFGILGIIFFVMIFYYMSRYALTNKIDLSYTGFFIICSYLFICVFEIYLQRHFLSSTFSVLVSSVFLKRKVLHG